MVDRQRRSHNTLRGGGYDEQTVMPDLLHTKNYTMYTLISNLKM
jgi:hypothetical protein